MSTADMVIVLEHCRVSPPPGTVAEKYFPLTFLDLFWLLFHPSQFLFFYDFPTSRSYFTHTIAPNLKDSLSFVLKHFFPFAGNAIIPPSVSTSKPEIRYLDGDSVSITFAECTNDFNHLSANHARNTDELFHLVPQLSPVTYNASDCQVRPLLAVQVTLFPNQGVSVGFTSDHLVGDASTMFNFRRAWASIAKLGGEAPLLLGGSFHPFYDRSVIQDPKGLDTIFWSQMGKYKPSENSQLQLSPIDQVRATFVMYQADIQGLKNFISTQRPTIAHVSSFTVACAYVWTCMAKARVAIGEEVNEDELEHFGCTVDCRARLDPPIPATYFGNCIAPCWVTIKSTQLVEEGGFLTAAEVIGEAIHTKVHNKEGVLKGAEMWITEFETMIGHRMFGVAGSPKFDFYNIDFGWGNPKKIEIVSGKMSLLGCKDSKGDLEIGLCFPKNEMDAFTTIFAKGLI